MHAHRHTIRYRLRRIGEITGLDVLDFEAAVQLYLAMKASELS